MLFPPKGNTTAARSGKGRGDEEAYKKYSLCHFANSFMACRKVSRRLVGFSGVAHLPPAAAISATCSSTLTSASNRDIAIKRKKTAYRNGEACLIRGSFVPNDAPPYFFHEQKSFEYLDYIPEQSQHIIAILEKGSLSLYNMIVSRNNKIM